MLLISKVDKEHNIDTSVDSEVGNFFDNRAWAPNINHSLVNSHFKVIVGVGTVTTRGAAGGDGEDLGGDSLGAGNLETLLLGTGNDLGAGVLEGLDLATAEGHSNLVDILVDLLFFLHVFLCHLD